MPTSSPYLDLVKKALTGSLHDGMDGRIWRPRGALRRLVLRKFVPDDVTMIKPVTGEMSEQGRGYWPAFAHTMLGKQRLESLHQCVETVLREKIPGDFIETGVWRGGACIFMRAILKDHGITDRRVWVADSFQGLPRPDEEKYAADRGDTHHVHGELAVSLEQVRRNFEHYGLLDDQVRFLKGWFKDTLPSAPIERLAIARLDGDMYESTMDALASLYPKLSRGGFLIIDDYGAVPACKQATHDFRKKLGIEDEVVPIDWTGVYWRKS